MQCGISQSTLSYIVTYNIRNVHTEVFINTRYRLMYILNNIMDLFQIILTIYVFKL